MDSRSATQCCGEQCKCDELDFADGGDEGTDRSGCTRRRLCGGGELVSGGVPGSFRPNSGALTQTGHGGPEPLCAAAVGEVVVGVTRARRCWRYLRKVRATFEGALAVTASTAPSMGVVAATTRGVLMDRLGSFWTS